MTKAERLMVTRMLEELHRRLLAIYRRRVRPTSPKPCRTCAFRMPTDARVKGFEFTVNGLRKAIQGRAIFVCHQQRTIDGHYVPHKRMRFCAGYAVIAGDPACERVVHEAAIDAASGS